MLSKFLLIRDSSLQITLMSLFIDPNYQLINSIAMANNYTDLRTTLSASKQIPSDFADGEEDSDTGWGSVSECHSNANSEDALLHDSISCDIPTVRTKPDGGDSEIQKLINAAETLALERAKLNLSGFITAADKLTHPPAPVVGVKSLNPTSRISQKEHSSLDEKSENKGLYDVHIQLQNNNTGASSSHFQSDDCHTSRLAPNRYTHSIENLSKFEESGRKLNDVDEIEESQSVSLCDFVLSKTSEVYQDAKDYSILQENEKLEGDSLRSIPKLSLEHTGALSNDSDLRDEKNPVSKDVKEVCNSTIRESSTDGSNVQIIPQAKYFLGSDNSKQNLQQTRQDLREVSLMVHDECSCLLSLALTSTSSLSRLIRLLRQVSTLQLGADTPRVAENVLEELTEYEDQHNCLQTELSSAAAQLQMVVAQVQGIEIIIGDQQREASSMEQCASQLLAQVEAGLESIGLKHMMAVTSPRRRSTARMLEDIASALALLIGELNRKSLRNLNVEDELKRHYEEIEFRREALLKRETRLRASELELLKVKKQSKADVTSLKQCLAQAEENLNETQLEKMKISEASKKLAIENGALIIQLQHKLSDLQRDADSRVSNLEHKFQDAVTVNQSLESTVVELKNKLSLQTKQINFVDEENNLLIEGLRSTIRRQQDEEDQLRRQLDSITSQKSNLTRRMAELESELAAEHEQQEKLIKEVSELKSSISNLKLEHIDSEKALRDKIDVGSAARCELEGRIRSLDLAILQLRTELQMEKHRSTALFDEKNSLQKKVRDLQERIWSQNRRRRNNSSDSIRSFDSIKSSSSLHSTGGSAWEKDADSECGSCHSTLPTIEGSDRVDQQVQCIMKEVGEGQAREEQLHTLLREKDAALHNLQHSLSTQITTKNQELEALSGKINFLEDQLESLLSGLEVSAAIGNITTEVGRLLQDRTSHLDSLDHSSHWLQEEMSSLALENQTLNNELLATKMSKQETSEAQESARRARQEAREERLSAARLREKCLQLQTKLDHVQYTLEHERHERRLTDTVHGIKHQEFGSLLDCTTALQQTFDPQESAEKPLISINMKT
nr:myosin heavy chain, striated muscle-like isoform X2 [Procambarus clarkii]